MVYQKIIFYKVSVICFGRFVEGKKKIGLENMNVCLYNESRKTNSMYDCERPWKAGLITGLDEGGYAIMGHDITKIH